jgi:SprT protein
MRYTILKKNLTGHESVTILCLKGENAMLKRRVEDKILDLMVSVVEFEDLDIPEITFDLKGQCAGMCRWTASETQLRFNLKLLTENTEDFLRFTVPHEVAHYVARKLFGEIQPHGEEWQLIMKFFGIEDPHRCHNFDVSSLNPWEYRCNCQTHYLSNRRHAHASKEGKGYVCNDCKEKLNFVGKRT